MPEIISLRARGVAGAEHARLDPHFWLAQLDQPDRLIMDADAIAAHNARVVRLDPHIHDLRELPATLPRATLVEWVRAHSQPSHRKLYDTSGKRLAPKWLTDLTHALALDAIKANTRVRIGMVVHRTALRTFPTMQPAYSRRGSTDIDRFQECAATPGTPVAILHESRDGEWYFVETPLYRAWVRREHVALGSAGSVFRYIGKAPFLVITGASAHTVFTHAQPAVSALHLDMGTRIPLLPDWPDDRPVNGQGASTSHVIELPVRRADGSLGFAHALLQRIADTRAGYLPLTRGNILRQAFKFLGEPYGWGGAGGTRDCSGFVSDVYRSMGILMPRNTGAQGTSPAADRSAFDQSSTHTERMRALRRLEPGDLIYTPRHVMLYIGKLQGRPWVIHDVIEVMQRGPGDKLRRTRLNAVAVTPLLPMLFNHQQTLVDRMTAIVRVRAARD